MTEEKKCIIDKSVTTDLIKIAGIAGIVAIEIVNLLMAKYDGALLAMVIAVVSGLAGYEIGKTKIPSDKEIEKLMEKAGEQ